MFIVGQFCVISEIMKSYITSCPHAFFSIRNTPQNLKIPVTVMAMVAACDIDEHQFYLPVSDRHRAATLTCSMHDWISDATVLK